MKAAEDLKKQQMLKEQERQRILQERILPLPDLDNIPDGLLATLHDEIIQYSLFVLKNSHANACMQQRDVYIIAFEQENIFRLFANIRNLNDSVKRKYSPA